MRLHTASLAALGFLALLLEVGIARAQGRIAITKADGSVTEYTSLRDAFGSLGSGEALRVSGRHVVVPNYGGGSALPLNAPLHLIGKENVVIRGDVDAEIHGDGPGDFLGLTDCTNILVEGITFSGNRPQPMQISDGLFSMINLSGLCRDITVSRCRFLDFGDHGVSHLWSPKTSTQVLVSECLFQNGGSVDVPGLEFDGAAVSGIGSYWTIRKCKVVDCARGFEIENAGTNTVEGVQISDNTLIGVQDVGVMLFVTNGDGKKFTDISISGNTFKEFRHPVASATAIRLAGGHRVQIRDNIVHSIQKQGIVVVTDGTVSDVQIRGNTVSVVGNNGIALAPTGPPLSNVSVSENRVSYCGEAGIRITDVEDVVVAGNVCFNNGRISVAGGIELAGAVTRRPLVRGNKCYDSEDEKTQDYGILIGPAVIEAMLRDNYCTDERAVVAGIQDQGLRTDAYGNKTSAIVTAPSGSLISAVLVNAPTAASISVQPTGSVLISWPMMVGQQYRLEYKASLVDTTWTTLTNFVSTLNGPAQIEDSLSTNSSRYYRIVESP